MNKNQNSILILLIAAACFYFAFGGKLPTPSPVPTPTPDVVVPDEDVLPLPPESLRQSVQPVISSLQDYPSVANKLSMLYLRLAESIEKNPGITTTAQVRELYTKSLEDLIRVYDLPRPIGFPEAADAFLEHHLTKQLQTLTPELRSKIVAAFRVLAWASQQVRGVTV